MIDIWMAATIRILFLADSHLGFDLPARPRVDRRRRGPDFVANYAKALEPALKENVDLVVHGGDVFDRPGVPASVAWQALEPLAKIADAGIPVFVVPGNHERSRLPHRRFAEHRRVHIFDRPRTYAIEVRGQRIALAGFPYERRDIRTRFVDVVERTGWRTEHAPMRLLCVHHCVEGATVGPGNFTFTTASDVIRAADIPRGFGAVLSGHIHRHQALTRDLRGRPLAAPVLYPGSIEKTSFAETGEAKGFLLLDMSPDEVRWRFMDLPSRPMVTRDLNTDDRTRSIAAKLGRMVAESPADAILRIRVTGTPDPSAWRALSAARIRSIAPSTMTVEVRAGDASVFGRRPLARANRRHAGRAATAPPASAQLGLGGDIGG
jgi:exonuclease SbcD